MPVYTEIVVDASPFAYRRSSMTDGGKREQKETFGRYKETINDQRMNQEDTTLTFCYCLHRDLTKR